MSEVYYYTACSLILTNAWSALVEVRDFLCFIALSIDSLNYLCYKQAGVAKTVSVDSLLQ